MSIKNLKKAPDAQPVMIHDDPYHKGLYLAILSYTTHP